MPKNEGKDEEERRHPREGPRKSRWRMRQEFLRRSARMEESVNRNRQRCVRQCNIARTRS